jgi:hypothetical protein
LGQAHYKKNGIEYEKLKNRLFSMPAKDELIWKDRPMTIVSLEITKKPMTMGTPRH